MMAQISDVHIIRLETSAQNRLTSDVLLVIDVYFEIPTIYEENGFVIAVKTHLNCNSLVLVVLVGSSYWNDKCFYVHELNWVVFI